MRKSTILSLLLIVTFLTAGMGLPLVPEGKLSVSNLTPVAFLIVALVFFIGDRRRINARFVWFFLIFNVTCAASFGIFLAKYEWTPNFPVLFFEDVELVFCALLCWFAAEYPAAFTKAVKVGILASIPVSILYGLHDLHERIPAFSDGMDDKSQGAVLLCCEAYILIRFFGNRLNRLAGMVLYLASFLTISRLPVFFLPAIFLGLARRSRLGAVLVLAVAGASTYVVIVAQDFVEDTFFVYNRLSSVEAITGSESTQAHLELLKTAVEIKFTEPLAFVFGIGPDNFSKALVTVPSSVQRLEALDPHLVEFAEEGKAPLHSTPMQMLLDYNIGVFMIFAFVLLRAFRFLMRRRNFTDTAFALGLLLASTFYSLHNKPYFYLYVTSVALLIMTEAPVSESSIEPAPSLLAPGDFDECREQG